MSAVLNPAVDPHRLPERLAYAGLLPFVLGSALVWLIDSPEPHAFVVVAMSTYAALVISFLGGIHWGLSFLQRGAAGSSWVWGVSASLLGWFGALLQGHAGLAVHGAVLIACYVMDRRFYPTLGAASWLTMRFRLSAVAALCCFLAAAGS
jgi:hypothetical protein